MTSVSESIKVDGVEEVAEVPGVFSDGMRITKLVSTHYKIKCDTKDKIEFKTCYSCAKSIVSETDKNQYLKGVGSFSLPGRGKVYLCESPDCDYVKCFRADCRKKVHIRDAILYDCLILCIRPIPFCSMVCKYSFQGMKY
jgi:hypothetical protein